MSLHIVVILVLSILSGGLTAKSTIVSGIYAIDYGNFRENPILFLHNGRVLEIKSQEKRFLKDLIRAQKNKSILSINLSSQNTLLDFKISENNLSDLNENHLHLDDRTYSPTILHDIDQARNYFTQGRRDFNQDSQCYNRAHVWAYDWRSKNNLYTSKVWLFFTQKFIRKYKFEWWFHVAPMAHVVINNEVKQRVMDIKYSNGPLPLNDWTRIFLRNNADCPVVDKYSDYANYSESGSCFVMKSSMYQYQPIDLENEELTGISKKRWIETEVKESYLNAFNISI
jgi:hypothetical protein